ncbi:MAG: YcxB family protein [Lachnospiraceae bacterium]|nr:YcxB family protein [Lachnospiraceae bacterium]
MSIQLDVKLDKKSLSRFLLYHNYARPAGVIGVIISLAAIVALCVRWDFWTTTQRGILVVLALLFTVLQPLMLLWKGKKQLQMEEFQEHFHYVFDEKGVVISQKEQKQEFPWKEIRKIVYRRDAVYVYMSTVSAFVLPKNQCGEQYGSLVEMMKEHKRK